MIPPYSRKVMAHRRRVRRLIRTVVAVAVIVLVLVVLIVRPFSGGGGRVVAAKPPPTPRATSSGGAASLAPVVPVTATLSGTPPTLKVNAMVKGLPVALSRAQAQPDGPTLLVLGGLAGGQSSAAVRRFSPASDTVVAAGTLAVATHDAASALLGTSAVVFGGGEAVTIDKVQTFNAKGSQVIGALPQARSDLVAAAVAGRIYLLGGYDGKSDQADVLMTTDGATYKVITQLPTPVRYAGVVALGTTIYVIGGEHNGVQTADIQAVDVAAGTAKVVAMLPVPLSHESIFLLGGSMFLAGGRAGTTTRTQVDVIDPTTGALTRAGLLPRPAADMALGQIGNDVYLIGGESPAPLNTIVHIGTV